MENNENAKGQLLRTKSEFDISDSALGTVMFILLNILFSVVVTVAGIKIKMGTFSYYLLHLIVEGLFAIAAILVAKIKNKNIIDATGMRNKINGPIVGWCFLVAVISLLGFGSLTNVFIAFLEHFGFSTDGGNIEINNFGQYVGMLLSSCAMAGLAEELLFRGVIQSGFKKWGIKVSVGFSALIFMLMHGSALQTIHQMIIGIIIGYVYFKTGNLWIGVMIHFFNNFIPVTEVFLLTVLSTPETSGEVVAETVAGASGLGTLLIDLISALIVAWAGYYFISRILKKIIKENEKANGKPSEKEMVASIVVDGESKEVEMSIDGDSIQTEQQNNEGEQKKLKMSTGTIVMFSIGGFYLIMEWIINTIVRFM